MLRALCAAASFVGAFGFVFDLCTLIAGYHPTNRVPQIAWLPVYALMAFAWFMWFRSYSARIATVMQSTDRAEPKPH